MHKIALLIAGSFMISTLTAPQVINGAGLSIGQSEPRNPKNSAKTPQPEMGSINLFSPPSKEKTAYYEIMNLSGGYWELLDPNNLKDVVEQSILIESIRHELAPKKSKKSPSPLAAKMLESQKVFGNSHIEAALSLFRVHSGHFASLLPEVKFVGWGGRFVEKINRFEMLYAIDKMPITSELYAMLLFSFLEDINLHEERFAPYLATFPVTSEEYELRFMLPGYRTLSTKQDPQGAFIFNIGETICFCHREKESGSLKIFKKEQFGDIIKNINNKIAEEKNGKNPKEAKLEQKN
jgi:hypothetical protein